MARQARRGLAGQLVMYSRLNVESARFARIGQLAVAEQVARAAAEIEAGPEFDQVQRSLEELPTSAASQLAYGTLSGDAPARALAAVRALAIRTEQSWDAAMQDDLPPSPAEATFAGQVAALFPGHAVLSQSDGPAVTVPRWVIDVQYLDAGAPLVLLADKLDHASAVMEAVPGIDIGPELEASESPRRAQAGYKTKRDPHTMRVMDSVSRVSRNGQVSVPADIRRRWGTSRVLVRDRGSYAIIRPVPEDPIGSLLGAYAGLGPSSEELRAAFRAEEAAAEDRRQGASG